MMGWRASAGNLIALQYWAASEGVPDTLHNWLATSLRTTGWYTPPPPYSEPAYDTKTHGCRALALTISEPAYVHVTQAFLRTGTLTTIWQAINATPWCAGCQGGLYPVQLYDYIGGSVVAQAPYGGTAPPAPVFAYGESTQDQLLLDMWAALTAWVQTITLDLWQTAYNATAWASAVP